MIRFSDGIVWDLDGEYRIKTDPDGFMYIHGNNVSIPVGFDRAEAEKFKELKQQKTEEKK